jgi:small subunit ribosomal protein S11
MASEKKSRYARKKVTRQVEKGRVYIRATYNNTLVTVTDSEGQVLSWSTAGASGFKGSRKSTPYAGQVAAKEASEKAKQYGLAEVDVYVKGVGTAREQAIRSLQTAGLQVNSIIDETPIPHGGCRPKKPRRV